MRAVSGYFGVPGQGASRPRSRGSVELHRFCGERLHSWRSLLSLKPYPKTYGTSRIIG